MFFFFPHFRGELSGGCFAVLEVGDKLVGGDGPVQAQVLLVFLLSGTGLEQEGSQLPAELKVSQKTTDNIQIKEGTRKLKINGFKY